MTNLSYDAFKRAALIFWNVLRRGPDQRAEQIPENVQRVNT